MLIHKDDPPRVIVRAESYATIPAATPTLELLQHLLSRARAVNPKPVLGEWSTLQLRCQQHTVQRVVVYDQHAAVCQLAAGLVTGATASSCSAGAAGGGAAAAAAAAGAAAGAAGAGAGAGAAAAAGAGAEAGAGAAGGGVGVRPIVR